MFKIVSTLRCFVWTRKVTSSCGSSSHANCCRWSWWFQPQTRAPPKDKQETYIETSKAFSKIPGIYRHWYPKLHRNVSFPFILPFLCLLRLTFACKLLNISFHPWKPIHFGRGISLPSSLFATNPCTSNQPTFIQIPSTSPGMVMLFVLVEVRLGAQVTTVRHRKKIHRNPPPEQGRTRTTKLKSYLWFSWFIGFMVSLHLFFTLQDFWPKIDPRVFCLRCATNRTWKSLIKLISEAKSSGNPKGKSFVRKKRMGKGDCSTKLNLDRLKSTTSC